MRILQVAEAIALRTVPQLWSTMNLVAISGSSRVVASGYEDGLLRVVFTDGAVYDAENIPELMNAAFLASPSKGQFIKQWLDGKLKRSTVVHIGHTIELREPEPSPKMLNSHEPDPCCGKHISKALLSGALNDAIHWECPECGEQWKPELHGTVRHWQPHPFVAIVPVQR